MHKSKIAAAAVLMSGFVFSQTASAYIYNDFYTVYRLAKSGDAAGLKKQIARGLDLNAEDSRGETAICYMVYQNDHQAYDLLKSLRADTDPRCMDRIPKDVKQAFFNKSTSISGTVVNAAAILGVAGIGTAAALASGGSGGGNGGDGGDTQTCPDGLELVDGVCMGATRNSPLNEKPESFITPQFTNSNFLSQINAEYAYARGYTGFEVERDAEGNPANGADSITSRKVTVAVYDSGVAANNPGISPNLLSGFNFDYGPCHGSDNSNCYKYDAATQELTLVNGDGDVIASGSGISAETWAGYYNLYAPDYDWDNEKTNSEFHEVATPTQTEIELNSLPGSHGTHVAGIIAGAETEDINGMHGVAPNAQILPVVYDRWLGLFNEDAMKTMVDRDVKVINISFGDKATDAMNSSKVDFLRDYLVNSGVDLTGQGTDALSTAFKKNVVLVMAAGNDSNDNSSLLSGIPALMPSAEKLFLNVVAVNKDNQLASYSNKCGSTQNWCLAAPGGEDSLSRDDLIYSTVIPTANGNYGYMAGTSMAAPSVSGSIALLMGAFPHLQAQDVVSILLETAQDLGDPGVDEVYGHGLIDLNKATQPVGSLTIPGGDTVTETSLALNNTRMALPATLSSGLAAKLPQNIVMLDKYSRAYPLAVTSLMNRADKQKAMEHDMRRFATRRPLKSAAVNDKLSLSFSERSSRRAGDLLLGSMDMDFKLSNREQLSFFYSEDTSYDHGNYFSKASRNPFVNMNNAYGLEHSYRFNSLLSYNFSAYTGENGFYDFDERLARDNDNRFNAFASEINLSPSDSFSVALLGGMLKEDGSMLGIRGLGALNTSGAETTFGGVRLTFNPHPDWSLKTAYYTGTTRGTAANSLMNVSELKSDSFAVDVEYKLDKNAKLGLQLSSPLMINDGSMHFDLPVGRDPHTDKIYREEFDVSMRPHKRELNLGTYFVHEQEDDTWFQAEVGARFNPDHQDTDTDYRLMLGWGARF